MCGIVVAFQNKNFDLSSSPVAKMLDAISHRGKDQITINHHGHCVVGYRRLAITDIHENKTSGIYLNGEIYNYRELGYEGTECEVIMQGLAEYGIDFIKRLNGMFFIVAIYGENVYVFRDRYGIKPVYYSVINGVTIIASEAKAIVEYPGYEFKVNESAKSQWFVFNNCLTDETLFEGIYKLDKGTTWHLNTNEKIKYWEWKFVPDENMNFNYAKKKIRELIKQSIQRQTPAEVQYGCCLSGGVDSNIIASQLNKNVDMFTVGYTQDEDELEMAKLAGYKNHHEVYFSQIYKFQETIKSLEDLRVGDSWMNYGLYEFISQSGKKVCFDGAGADELFGGYSWRYVAKDYYDIVNRTKETNEYCRELFNRIFPIDTIENRFKFDAEYFLEGVLLVVDKLSMAHTIEIRLPFLDNDLVDFCLSLPFSFKQNKNILKSAFDNVLHPEIIKGKKRGFSTPDWITGDGNRAMKWATAAFNEWENIYKK